MPHSCIGFVRRRLMTLVGNSVVNDISIVVGLDSESGRQTVGNFNTKADTAAISM